MEKVKMIEKLESVLKCMENDMELKNTFMYMELEDIKNEIYKDMKLENCKKSTKASKLNAIKRVLENKSQIREILHTYIIENGKMMFTDSYVAFAIDDLEDNPFKKFDGNGTYPDLKNVGLNDDVNGLEEVSLDLADIRTFAKIHRKNHKTETYHVNGVDNVNFDCLYLLNVVDIMPSDTKYYLFNNGNLLKGYSESTKDICIICGVRKF